MSHKDSSLLVRSCGMTTAVGFTATSSCAAIRSGISGFKETRFSGLGGDPIVGAEVPLAKPLRGLARLTEIVAGPILECIDSNTSVDINNVPLLLGVAEKNRPGRFDNLENALIPSIEKKLGVRFHQLSHIVPRGRVAGAFTIHEASKLIFENGFRYVIVAGVDSYLVSDTLDHFEDDDRLLTGRNSDGFVPGEAGSALLLSSNNGSSGLKILSIGIANETVTIYSERPLRAEGLADAYRQALETAGIGLHDIDFRIADFSGEQYWFKEAALALARVMRERKEFQDIWHPADCLGEIGAAALPCIVSIVWWAARKGYAPGPLALVQSCGDEGSRVAIVIDGSSCAVNKPKKLN